jgi:GMP synthase-like glutamine amidotransferase
MYPSGKFYIIVYVVELPEENGWKVVTKISDNARTWTSKGPPEFSLPMPSDPWMIFTNEGARLFYLAREESKRDPPDTRTLARSAFCPKAAYEPR